MFKSYSLQFRCQKAFAGIACSLYSFGIESLFAKFGLQCTAQPTGSQTATILCFAKAAYFETTQII